MDNVCSSQARHFHSSLESFQNEATVPSSPLIDYKSSPSRSCSATSANQRKWSFSLTVSACDMLLLIKMEWRCVFNFCVFTAISLRILLSHLNQVHSDHDFHIVCSLGDTPACRKILITVSNCLKEFLFS